MQFVDPAHQSQIAVRHWSRQILAASTAEAEKLRLAHDRQFVLAVDDFCPAILPRRAHRIKIIFQRQFADLGMKCLHIDGWTYRFGLRFIANTPVAPEGVVFPV